MIRLVMQYFTTSLHLILRSDNDRCSLIQFLNCLVQDGIGSIASSPTGLLYQICKRATFKDEPELSLRVFVPADVGKNALTFTQDVMNIGGHATRVPEGQCFIQPGIHQRAILPCICDGTQVPRTVGLGIVSDF